jgi:hypothetical protein
MSDRKGAIMRVSASIYPRKLALLATAGAIAIITAFTVPAAPASATVTHTSAAAITSASTVFNPCISSAPANTHEFFRCTADSQTGPLVAGACNTGQNYNVSNAPFNVYSAYNYCGWRVWLHQQTNWSQGGWAYCINPPDVFGAYQQVPEQFQHPDNIYITSNIDACGPG